HPPPSALKVPLPTATSPLSLHDALPISMLRASSFSFLDGGFGTGLGFGVLGGNSVADIGNETTIPCRALASLKFWFRSRRMPGPDRKSTRLNSSHVKISYAVFCLKKKRT